MSRPFRPLTAPALLLCLLGGLTGLAAGPEIVELPTLAVIEKAAPGTAHVTIVPIETDAGTEGAFADLARQTAGFAINDAGARGFGATTTLRGLGNTPFFSDASAPVYLDDIPLATGFTFPSELYDFSAMTIHRGPQAAALFGRAADAGVIQFTSAEPGKTNRANFRASVGNHGQQTFSASVQTARRERFDAAASVGTSKRDGYIYNPDLKQTVDDRAATFGRVKLRYRPAPDLEISLHGLGQRSRDGAQALVPLGGPDDEVRRGKEGEAEADFAAVALGVTRKFSGATLSSTTSYTNWNLSPYSNRIIFFGRFDFDSALTQSQRTFNEELRYTSDQLSGGAFFSHSRTEGGASRTFSGFPIEDSSFTLSSDSFAVFGQANLKPSANWRLTPGLRFEHAGRDFVRTETVPGNAVNRQQNHWNAFLPSLAATRHLNSATDLTLTLARGFKAGGYSAYTGRADLAGFDPQRTWGLEAAVTTASPDSSSAFTARAYASRVNGYQIERSFAVPATSTDEYLVVNAQRARVLGLELESSWRPAADVTVRAVAGLTEVTLQDFTDPFTQVGYSGNRAPYAPAGNGALRVDYHPPGGLFAGAGLTWTGKTYYDEQETALFSQDAYTLVDASVGYTFARGDIRLFGRNLAGQNYYSSITPGVGHGTPGAPRLWGVAVNCRW